MSKTLKLMEAVKANLKEADSEYVDPDFNESDFNKANSELKNWLDSNGIKYGYDGPGFKGDDATYWVESKNGDSLRFDTLGTLRNVEHKRYEWSQFTEYDTIHARDSADVGEYLADFAELTDKIKEFAKDGLKESVEVIDKVFNQLVEFLTGACKANQNGGTLQHDEEGDKGVFLRGGKLMYYYVYEDNGIPDDEGAKDLQDAIKRASHEFAKEDVGDVMFYLKVSGDKIVLSGEFSEYSDDVSKYPDLAARVSNK